MVLLLAAAISALWHLHLVDTRFGMIPSHSDLLPRWVGTRAALRGENPYSAAVLREIQTAYYGRPLTAADHARPQAFLYPAWMVILLAPLAPLSWPAARAVFLLAMTPLLGWGAWLCMKMVGLPRGGPDRALTLGFFLFSWAAVWGLRLQQPTVAVAAAVFLSVSLLSRGKEATPGVLLAMATVKPQLVLPLLVWLLLWAGLRRKFVFIAAFAATFGLLAGLAEWVTPHWMPVWLASMRSYGAVTHTAAPLEWLLGHWVGLAATGAVALAAGYVLWRLRGCEGASAEFAFAVSLALAATVSLVPTDLPMIYNYVLLLPACLLLIFRGPAQPFPSLVRTLALVQLAWDFVALPVAVAGESGRNPAGFWTLLPFFDFLLPFLTMLALVLMGAERMRERAAPQAEATAGLGL